MAADALIYQEAVMNRQKAMRTAAEALRGIGSDRKTEFAAKTLDLAANAAEIVADSSLDLDDYTEGFHAALNALWMHIRRG